MEAKCSFCEFFGAKTHCHNCKVFNKATYTPQEINCSLDELIEYINTTSIEDILSRFHIGDYKTIELYTGERIKITILDFDKDALVGNEGCAKVSFGVFVIDGKFQMNEQNTNEGGWMRCKMRNVVLDRVFKLLPESLRNNIKTVQKKTSAGSGSRDIITTEDKLFLFSEIEVRGTYQYARPGEGEQYEYFEKPANRNALSYVWLRSPYYGGSYYFCCMYGGGGSGYSYADNSSGVAFGFCL